MVASEERITAAPKRLRLKKPALCAYNKRQRSLSPRPFGCNPRADVTVLLLVQPPVLRRKRCALRLRWHCGHAVRWRYPHPRPTAAQCRRQQAAGTNSSRLCVCEAGPHFLFHRLVASQRELLAGRGWRDSDLQSSQFFTASNPFTRRHDYSVLINSAERDHAVVPRVSAQRPRSLSALFMASRLAALRPWLASSKTSSKVPSEMSTPEACSRRRS